MSKLTETKEVPAGHSCPFLYKCNMIGPTCPTPAKPHKIDFRCSVARKLDLEEPKTLDEKITELLTLTNDFLFIELNYHFVPNSQLVYKIIDPFYSTINQHILILFPVSEGFEKSLDEALRRLKLIKINQERRHVCISENN